MTNAVFTTKMTPAYNDVPEIKYHFPKTYLGQVTQTVGDLIVYYEPRRSSSEPSSRGGRQSYFATARVKDIVPDNERADHFYALVNSFLSFESHVPFRDHVGYYELSLQRDDGETNKGAFGRSVRLIGAVEFDTILKAGFTTKTDPWDAASANTQTGFAEDDAVFERPLVEQTVLRPFRDDAFRRVVRAAYDNRCAISGIRLINGGGRPEVQAAHIRPVAHDGPEFRAKRPRPFGNLALAFRSRPRFRR